MSKALIIDDEDQMRRLLRLALESRGYQVGLAADGESGLREAAVFQPDIILLDLGLPDIGGVEVLRRLREWNDVPVLILSVRDQESIKVLALESGADDYVTKPFSTAELLARLAVIQRRRFTRRSPEITAGPLHLDLAHHQATLDGEPLKLTPIEFSMLKTLAEYPGRLLTHRQLAQQVWPGQSITSSEGLRVHINHLRQKLASSTLHIINEPGIGYRLEIPDD
jgi:two-component system KDP operon response regulator KdpE